MNQDRTPGIIYMGTPEFAVAPLNALLENGFNVLAVVTVPDKQAGRGLKLSESAVKKFAAEKGLPILQPVSLKDESFLNRLRSFNADMFIVVAFRMLPKAVWSMPPMGTFNLHGSLLPQYRGAAPINWAIINGERKSGVTTFLINEEIDTGNILLQRETQISEDETIGTLYDRLMKIGADLVVESVRGLLSGAIVPKPQQETDMGGILHPAPKITKELCRINWKSSAEEIGRLVRGLSPYPAAFTVLSNGNKILDLKVYKAEICPECAEESAGTVHSDNRSFLEIACGKGAVRLLEVQAAGKRRMGIKEFLAGFREAENYRAL